MNQVLLMLFAVCTIVHRIDGQFGCLVDNIFYANGATIPDEDPCKYCFCFISFGASGVVCNTNCPALPCDENSQITGPNGCCPICPGCTLDDGTYYEIGQEIPDDPCQYCNCTGLDEITCASVCEPLPCDENSQIAVPNECCPICPGCTSDDGTYYEIGANVPVDLIGSCLEVCLCMEGDVIDCEPKVCLPETPLPCDESIQITGSDGCCPICPPGCTVDDVFYLVGDTVPENHDPCASCMCELNDNGNPEVVCSNKTCGEPECIRAFDLEGKCCPVCPGDPCEDIFPQGMRIQVGGCTLQCCNGKVKAWCRGHQ